MDGELRVTKVELCMQVQFTYASSGYTLRSGVVRALAMVEHHTRITLVAPSRSKMLCSTVTQRGDPTACAVIVLSPHHTLGGPHTAVSTDRRGQLCCS